MNFAALCWLFLSAVLSDFSYSHPVQEGGGVEAGAVRHADLRLPKNAGVDLKLKEGDKESGDLPVLKDGVKSELELFEGDLAISKELIDAYYSKHPVGDQCMNVCIA